MLLAQNLPAKALARVQSQIALVPDDAAFYLLLGQVQSALKDVNGAEQSVRKALSIDPNNSDAIFQLGELQQQKGSFDEAKASFERLVQKNPRDPRPFALLGMVAEADTTGNAPSSNTKKQWACSPTTPLQQLTWHI